MQLKTCQHCILSQKRTLRLYLWVTFILFLAESYFLFGMLTAINMCYAAAAAKSLQSCLTLCDPVDGSPPGSATPGILQAGTLEWVAISFSNAWK